MATVTIRGVPITFPFEPYELQKEYMEKVLECLQNETNGVLESPTGTGKTLSLLCSSLAWLQLKKAQLQMQRQAVTLEEENDYVSLLNAELKKTTGKTSGRSFLALPTIIYSSRTHSQLSQAMQELKRTAYSHMKACVLGSRDQMCIHPELINEQNSNIKRHMCQLKVKTRACNFFNRVERKKEDPAINGLSIVDIEDIIKLGNLHKFCPYYMSKELKQQADIIFMPYNYLLDPVARKALGVELANTVIILDEAHNIEKQCEEVASLEIKTSDIAMAIEEVTELMKAMSKDDSFDTEGAVDFDPNDLCLLKEILLNLEKELDNIELSNNPEGTNFDGCYIFDFLSNAGIKHGNYSSIVALVSNIVQFLSTVGDGPFARRGNGLQLLADFLLIVFLGDSEEFKQKVKVCYKVHVVEEEVKKKKANNWLTKAAAKPGGRTLSYWCFNPGFGMNMLARYNGVKSIILTSGTLAPLRPLISELDIDVPVRLENPHIVTGNQVCVKIITNGPDTETLNSSYHNRRNPKYIGSLGRAVLNLSRVIPNGLLIFFPSYPIMEMCAQHWQETGLWGDIYRQKAIFMEPRDKISFNNAMTEYYSKVQDPTLKGAIFMGVCRGKVAEGLDFADANGRAVIVTGLPFPPLKDPRIILKKRYLDIRNAGDKEFLKGDDWYSLEATRAVNQAIGRVIRHRHDYGAILLLDTRFNSFRMKNQMSMWLRNHIKVANNFGEVMRDLRVFFKTAEVNFPVAQSKSKLCTTSTIPPAEFEVPTTYKKSNFDFSTSTLPGTSTSEHQNENGEVMIHKRMMNESVSNPTKRLKINLIPNSTQAPTNLNTTPKEYIVMVKKILDAISFKNFASALRLYKENENFTELVDLLDEIFLNKPNVRYLILGLEPYIKTNHKDDFNKYWEKMR